MQGYKLLSAIISTAQILDCGHHIVRAGSYQQTLNIHHVSTQLFCATWNLIFLGKIFLKSKNVNKNKRFNLFHVMSAFANVAGRRGEANHQRPVLHMPQLGKQKILNIDPVESIDAARHRPAVVTRSGSRSLQLNMAQNSIFLCFMILLSSYLTPEPC